MTPPSASPAGPFKSLKEFYPYYKQEHCKTGTRALHVIGTSLFLLQAAAAGATRQPKLLLTGVLSAYSCAWLGHFFVEHNRYVDLYTGGGDEALKLQLQSSWRGVGCNHPRQLPGCPLLHPLLASAVAVTHTGQRRSSTLFTP